MRNQGLRQRIVTLLLVENPGKSHVATSSCYRRQYVDRKIYPGVWSKNYLFLPIEKAAAMIHISLSLIDLQGWYKSV